MTHDIAIDIKDFYKTLVKKRHNKKLARMRLNYWPVEESDYYIVFREEQPIRLYFDPSESGLVYVSDCGYIRFCHYPILDYLQTLLSIHSADICYLTLGCISVLDSDYNRHRYNLND